VVQGILFLFLYAKSFSKRGQEEWKHGIEGGGGSLERREDMTDVNPVKVGRQWGKNGVARSECLRPGKHSIKKEVTTLRSTTEGG